MEDKYAEGEIKVLEGHDAIRMRPAMYIGSVDGMGIQQLVKLLIEDIVEDAKTQVSITCTLITSYKITLNIKGVKLDTVYASFINTHIYVGGRNYYSVIANPLSASYNVSYKGKQQQFEKGVLLGSKECGYSDDVDIEMVLDEGIFTDLNIDYYLLCQMLYYMAVLNPTVEIKVVDKRGGTNNTLIFNFPDGIKSHFSRIRSLLNLKFDLIIDKCIGDRSYIICIGWREDGYKDAKHETYCNNEKLKWGGSLIDGIKQGLIGIGNKNISKGNKLNLELDGITMVASLKTLYPKWEGSTMWAIDMPDVEKEVKEIIREEVQKYIIENPENGGKLVSNMCLY